MRPEIFLLSTVFPIHNPIHLWYEIKDQQYLPVDREFASSENSAKAPYRRNAMEASSWPIGQSATFTDPEHVTSKAVIEDGGNKCSPTGTKTGNSLSLWRLRSVGGEKLVHFSISRFSSQHDIQTFEANCATTTNSQNLKL